MPDGHNVPNVGIQGPQYRQQCPGDSSQGKQEIYAGHLGTGHVPGRTIRSPITTFPPFDPPLAEEVDGPTRAPDTGEKVFLSGTQGEQVVIPQARGICGPSRMVADGGGSIPEAALAVLGFRFEAGS